MKPNQTESGAEREGAERRVAPPEAVERRQIYLRTLYPLNPGIPHFVDFPKGWE